MNAKEAREKSKLLNSGQLEDVISVIKKATEKGEYFCWYYQVFKDGIREQLTDLGYTVDATQFERNETMTRISW